VPRIVCVLSAALSLMLVVEFATRVVGHCGADCSTRDRGCEPQYVHVLGICGERYEERWSGARSWS
jgi:hypothetical protein